MNDPVAGFRSYFKIEFGLGDSFIKLLKIYKTPTIHAEKYETQINVPLSKRWLWMHFVIVYFK